MNCPGKSTDMAPGANDMYNEIHKSEASAGAYARALWCAQAVAAPRYVPAPADRCSSPHGRRRTYSPKKGYDDLDAWREESIDDPVFGFNCTSPRRAFAGPCPRAATCSDFHTPASSLGTASAGLRRGAGRNRIAAGANQVGAAGYPRAPSALPRDPTQAWRRPHVSID